MSIPGIESLSATATGSLPSANNQTQRSNANLDYDTYLKLLVAQMQNQDPLEPSDSTEWVAQLASFSQVEQAIQTNRQLGEMLTLLRLDRSDALIGRTFTSADGSVSGIVQSVQLDEAGLVARLEDGRRVSIGEGTTVA